MATIRSQRYRGAPNRSLVVSFRGNDLVDVRKFNISYLQAGGSFVASDAFLGRLLVLGGLALPDFPAGLGLYPTTDETTLGGVVLFDQTFSGFAVEFTLPLFQEDGLLSIIVATGTSPAAQWQATLSIAGADAFSRIARSPFSLDPPNKKATASASSPTSATPTASTTSAGQSTMSVARKPL